MRALPPTLPTRLADYAPDRITEVDPAAWPTPLQRPFSRTGITTAIPRYALDVRTCRTHIDPERLRWLAERVVTRPLATRHVHLAQHRGLLWVVDGHTALAAHLATGADRVPVRLVDPLVAADGVEDVADHGPGDTTVTVADVQPSTDTVVGEDPTAPLVADDAVA